MNTDDIFLGDRFKVVGLLGKGATALVLKAHDNMLEREVAIKMPLPDLVKREPVYQKVFLKEARYLANLQHPRILPLYECFDSTHGLVLVMRWVNSDLYRKPSEGSFSFPKVVELGRQIAEALDYCERDGVAHRDIKPANLLVDQDGYLFVTDFGLAARFDDDDKWLEVVGTPTFLAPELLEKIGVGSESRRRCDQFSFGVVLYNLLTGSYPFDRPVQGKYPSNWEMCTALRLRRHEKPIPCNQRKTAIPGSADAVLNRMMQIDPDSRFNSNIEAVQHLEDALDGRQSSDVQAFISFSHRDGSFVAPFVKKLQEEGFKVWWDFEINHGVDWDDQIESAMLESQVLLVFLSSQSLVSPESKREWKYWLDYIKKPIIPIMLSECRPPYRLSSLQHIKAIGKRPDSLADEVGRAILKSLNILEKEEVKYDRCEEETVKTISPSVLPQDLVLRPFKPQMHSELDDMATRVAPAYVLKRKELAPLLQSSLSVPGSSLRPQSLQ